jgi:hypothetical protein
MGDGETGPLPAEFLLDTPQNARALLKMWYIMCATRGTDADGAYGELCGVSISGVHDFVGIILASDHLEWISVYGSGARRNGTQIERSATKQAVRH